MFTLVNAIIAIIAMVIDNVLGMADETIGYGPLYGFITPGNVHPGIGSGSKAIARHRKKWLDAAHRIPSIHRRNLADCFAGEGQQFRRKQVRTKSQSRGQLVVTLPR